MSQPRIKAKKTDGPLDWIRTDDRSMYECFYILLMTRGLYSVLDSLVDALSLESEASRGRKAEFHPGWIQNAEFCEQAIALVGNAAVTLHSQWDTDVEEDVPPTARRKNPHVGGLYPLPGGGLYRPKK